MDWKAREAAKYAEIDKLIAAIPDDIKGSAFKAYRWAKNRLMRLEGEGHSIYIHRERDGMITCSFAKPEWPGDHSGRKQPTGALAIVGAVLEYENGF